MSPPMRRRVLDDVDRDIPPPRGGDRHRNWRRRRRCPGRPRFGFRMVLPANVTTPHGHQDCHAGNQIQARPVGGFLELF
jgi:hypothetical protein